MLLLPLYGCTGSRIAMGEVYNKQHEPEEDCVVMIPIVSSNGKTSITTMIPTVVHDDEDWILCIRKWNEEEQRFDTNRLFVTRELYEQVGELSRAQTAAITKMEAALVALKEAISELNPAPAGGRHDHAAQ